MKEEMVRMKGSADDDAVWSAEDVQQLEHDILHSLYSDAAYMLPGSSSAGQDHFEAEEEVPDGLDDYDMEDLAQESDPSVGGVCFICQAYAMHQNDGILSCSACGVCIPCTIPLAAVQERVAQLVSSHIQHCRGRPLFSFQENVGLLMFCSDCDNCQPILG
ncbi:hypothetical protein RI367_008288 [Sorochytrium milnesiophthora]